MFKIGEISKKCNISPKAIRLYETKGLLKPVYINKETGYRFYDEASIATINKIVFMKSLGLTLEDIRKLNNSSANDSSQFLLKKMSSIKKRLEQFSSLINKGGMILENFENDPRAIGKWQFIAMAKSKNDYLKGNIEKEKFLEYIYFLPQGEGYWIFDSWTKGQINLYAGEYKIPTACPYEIDDGYLYLSLKDKYDVNITDVVVFKQIDNKEYTKYEIGHHDNIDLPFESDPLVIGKWQGVDIVPDPNLFDTEKKFFENFVFKINFNENGNVEIFQTNGKKFVDKWTKNYWINLRDKVAQRYEIRNLNGQTYLFIEHKNGDYIYYNRVTSYFVFKKC